MEDVEVEVQRHQILATCNSSCTRSSSRRSEPNHSPEFEFWMTRNNPSFPQPVLLSADELFSDGILLPLDQLQDPNGPKSDPELSVSGRPDVETDLCPELSVSMVNSSSPNGPKPDLETEPSGSGRAEHGQELSASIVNSSETGGSGVGGGGAFTSSKRWKDIFKKTEKKQEDSKEKKEKDKRKEKKIGGGNNGVTGAELNINIWPFSRSRSAGNGGSRSRVTTGSGYTTRKVSSAPCSRSNSAGESKSRKWPSSPARGGVHLGRSSPVWQVRRNIATGFSNRSSDNPVKTAEKAHKKENKTEKGHRKTSSAAAEVVACGGGGAKARVLNLNVPMCIGYRSQLGCRSDENSAISIATVAGGDSGGSSGGSAVAGGEGVRGSNSNLFNIKSLFTKKVY